MKKYTLMRVLSAVLVLVLCMQLMPSTALAALIDNDPAYNAEILSALAEMVGSEDEAARYYALLEQYGLLDEDGNLSDSWEIWMDGEQVTLDDILALLDDPNCDLTKQLIVDDRIVSLGDVKTILEIEEYIEYLRETYFTGHQWTEEQQASLQSLMDQIASEGIVMSTLAAGSEWPSGISHDARVNIGEPTVSGATATFTAELTGALEGQEVTFDWVALSGSRSVAEVDEANDVNCGSITLTNGNPTATFDVTLGTDAAVHSATNLVYAVNLSGLTNALFTNGKTDMTVTATASAADEIGGTSAKTFSITGSGTKNFSTEQKNYIDRGLVDTMEVSIPEGQTNSVNEFEFSHLQEWSGTLLNAEIAAGDGGPQLFDLQEEQNASYGIDSYYFWVMMGAANNNRDITIMSYRIDYSASISDSVTARGSSGYSYLTNGAGQPLISVDTCKSDDTKYRVPSDDYTYSSTLTDAVLSDVGNSVTLSGTYTRRSRITLKYESELGGWSNINSTQISPNENEKVADFNVTATFTNSQPPTVESVSAPAGDYYPGQTVPVVVTYNEPVDASTATVTFDNVTTVAALEGSGYSNTLTFPYTVPASVISDFSVTNFTATDTGGNTANAVAVTDGSIGGSADGVLFPFRKTAALVDLTASIANEIADPVMTVSVSVSGNGALTTWLVADLEEEENIFASKSLSVRVNGETYRLISTSGTVTGGTLTATVPLEINTTGAEANHVVELVLDEDPADSIDGSVVIDADDAFYKTVSQAPAVFIERDDLAASITVTNKDGGEYAYTVEGGNRVIYPEDEPKITASFTLASDKTYSFGNTAKVTTCKYNENGEYTDELEDPDAHFVWKSSDTSVANITADGVILPTGKAGEVSFTLTALNGGIQGKDVSVTATYTVEEEPLEALNFGVGLTPYLNIASGGITAVAGSPLTMFWSSNIIDKNGETPTEFSISVEGGGESRTATVTNASSFTIPADYLKYSYEADASHEYTFTVATTYNGKEYSASTTITLESRPAVVTLDGLDTYYITDTDGGVDIKWNIENFDRFSANDELFRFEVTKDGERIDLVTDPGTGAGGVYQGGYTLEPADVVAGDDPAGYRDVYTVTIQAKNGTDSTWSYDSFLLYVYDEDALKIWVDGEEADSVTMSNVAEISQMRQDEILALKRDIYLKNIISINYGDYAWTEVADRIAWKSSDNTVATVNYQQGTLYENIEDFSYDSYRPTTELGLSGIGSGSTTVTATHDLAGMTETLSVTVETLKDKLYLFRCYPQTATTLRYQNSAGEWVETQTDATGSAAIFEMEGIHSDVYCTADVGGVTYLGTFYLDDLKTGEGDWTKLARYPVNSLDLRRAAYAYLYIKNPDGTPYTGDINFRGGVYVDGEYKPDALFALNDVSVIRRGDTDNRVTLDADGKLTVTMDQTQWGFEDGKVSATDDVAYVFEISKADGDDCYPMLITVDANVNADAFVGTGEAIVSFRESSGSRQPFIIEQRAAYSAYGTESDILGEIGNVGPSDNSPVVSLSNAVMWWGEDMSDVEPTLSLVTEGGLTVDDQHEMINNAYPFTSSPITKLTVTLNDDTMQAVQLGSGKGTGLYLDYYRDGERLSRREPLSFRLFNLIGLGNVENAKSLSDMLTTMGGISGTANSGGAEELKSDDRFVQVAMELVASDSFNEGSKFNLQIVPTSDPTKFLGLISVQVGNIRDDQQVTGIYAPSSSTGDFDVDYMPGLSEMMVMSGKRSIYSYLGDDFNKVLKRESVRNLKAQLGGYAESLIYFNEETYDWEIQILSGGFNMGAGVTYSWNFHTMAGPVPFTATLTIGGNFEVSMDALSVAYYNVQKDRTSIGTDFLTELRIYLYLHFFAGVGIDYAIIAFKLGIYGQISIDMRFQWLNRPYMDSNDKIVNLADGSINEEKLDGQRFKIDGQIGLQFVVRFLFFSFEQILFSYSFNLLDKTTGDWNKIQTNWEKNREAHQSAISTLLGNGSMTASNVGEGQMLSLNLAPTVESRDYLADGSFWNDGSISTFALDTQNATENLQYNSYPYANPVLTDDGKIIAYLSDMNSTDVEDTRASFAVRNEFGMYADNGAIDAINDAGYGDSQVAISGTESFAVAAWTRQIESIDKDAGAVLTAEDQMIMMNGTETYAGVYKNSAWSVERLTVNHSADLAPVVATNGNRAIVAWRAVASSGEIKDGVAGVTDFNEKDTILYRIYESGEWSDAQTLYNGTSGAVKGLVAEMLDDGTAAVAYTLDTDGDDDTVSDREIYYAVVDNTAEAEVARNVRATSDAYLDENPQLAAVTFPNAGERFVLGWYTEQPVTANDGVAAADASPDGETLADIRLLDFDGAGNYTQLLPDSINRAADAYDVSITPSFRFTKNAASINDLSIIWAERAAGTATAVEGENYTDEPDKEDYDLSKLETEKDVLKGVKFYTYGQHGELVSFTGAIDVAEMPESTLIDHFDAYVSDAESNEIKAVILGTTYGVDADNDDGDGVETRIAETVGGNTVQFSVPSSLTSMYTATETYEDKIDVPAVLIDYETVRKGADTRILFTVDNLGIHAIDQLDITVGDTTTTYGADGSLNLLPGGSIRLYADYTVPASGVEDAAYTVKAHFDESVGSTGSAETTRTTVYRGLRRTTEDLTSVSGTAYLDLPDAEITDASIIAEENGERTILIKLNNDSDASLNAPNRFVRVGFYSDATCETPIDEQNAYGLGSFDIKNSADLAMIDDGGYSISKTFDVEAYLAKISEGETEPITEIPDSGITVYIKAEVMEKPDDGSDAVTLPEPIPSNNYASVVCENLKTRSGENVSVTSDLALSDGGAAVTVNLRNNRLSAAASGNVIVFLLDEDGEVLTQQQSYDPSAANSGLITLGGEGTATVDFNFTGEEAANAASVEVVYSDLILASNNAALASLSFSGIPNVSLADFVEDPAEPGIYRHTVSVDGLGSTTVLAVAESAAASISLDGEDKGDGFLRDTVSLSAGSTRDIEITVVSEDGTQTFTYILTVQNGGSSGVTLRRVTIADSENGTVAADAERVLYGRTVTLTVTPNEGYTLDALTVADSNGNAVALTDNGDGVYTFTMPRRDVTVAATFKPVEETPTDEPPVEPTDEPCPRDETCPLVKFVDADPQMWYHDALHFVLENGLMIGTSENEFEPLAPMTRAMVVTILHRLEGEPTYGQGKSGTFIDVPEYTWYTEAVEWAAANGIVEGHGDGTFEPNGNVTREQLATILHRYAQYKGIDVSVGENTNILSYDDAFDVSDWAYPALQWACAAGIIEGKPSGDSFILDPQGDALRAEVAAMLMRFCEGNVK